MNESPSLVLCDTPAPPAAGFDSYSPFCLKIHRALALAGLAYETVRGRMPADFARYNPARQIPVLLVDGEPIADSTRILAELATFAPAILPGDARVRAEAWLWEDWADASLRGFVVAARWADPRNWPAVRRALFGGLPYVARAFVPGIVRRRVTRGLAAANVGRAGLPALWEDYRRVLDALEARAPDRGFWLGSAPSVADLAIFAALHSLRLPDLTPWQARELKVRPVLTDWLDRVDEATSRGGLARARSRPRSAAA